MGERLEISDCDNLYEGMSARVDAIDHPDLRRRCSAIPLSVQ